jgi:hypothetical protein
MSEGHCQLERPYFTGICILLLVYLTTSVARITVRLGRLCSVQWIGENTTGNNLDLLCGSIRTASEESGECHKRVSARTGNIRDGVWSSKHPNTKAAVLPTRQRNLWRQILLLTTNYFALVFMLFTKVLVTSTVWQMALLIRRTSHVPDFITRTLVRGV